MKDNWLENIYNGPIFAWTWLFISVIVFYWFLNKLSIQQIPLDYNSCSAPTILECTKKSIGNAEDEIRKNLSSRFQNVFNTREAFPLLKLLSADYILSITDQGSEFKNIISNPRKEFAVERVDQVCWILSKPNVLKYRGQVKLATVSITENDIETSINNTLKTLYDFGGCYWLPKKQKYDMKFPEGTVMAPNSMISSVVMAKLVLKFDIHSSAKAVLFSGIFALVGVAFALAKQLILMAKKGIKYFSED